MTSSVNPYARVKSTFRGSVAKGILNRRIGPEGTAAWINLLCAIALEPNEYKGGLTERDLFELSVWSGKPQEYVDALLDAGLIRRVMLSPRPLYRLTDRHAVLPPPLDRATL